MHAKVMSVESACFHINKRNPPQLAVRAIGQVNTSGWKGGELAPWIYVVQPADGIQDFEFIAIPPTGIVLEVITPIEGMVCGQMQDWMKGVRIHAATNHIEVLFGDKASSVKGRFLDPDDPTPWPWKAAAAE